MSLRKLALILTMAILVSATLFFPCVKASIELSSEFVEPVRNGSFKEGSNYWFVSGGWKSSAYALNGTYSWYTDGASLLQQELGDVIQVLKGKSVMFSFWFRPETVAEDGSENYARAALRWLTENGGGGCPYIFVWDGTQYVADNNILPASEDQDRSELDVEDFYRLERRPAVKQGKYSLLIREFESEHSYIDQVKLLVVDHKSDVNIAVSPTGETLTYGSPAPPVSAVNKEGENLTGTLCEADGCFYEGYEGDYVTVNFGNLDISDGAKLLIRSDALIKSPIYIQTLNSTGDWDTVATIYVRTNWSVDVVDLSPYLPSDGGELRVRLCFVSNDRIDFVGLDNTGRGKFEVQGAGLVQAVHSVEGNVKKELEESDGDYAEIPSGDQIRLEFTVPPTDEDSRDFVLYVKGHYVSHTGNPTATGDWVHPTELKWYNAYVTATLPSDLSYLKVIIEGKSGDFYAWVDVATLSIYTTAEANDERGILTFSANLFEYRISTAPITYKGEVLLAAALYAEKVDKYIISTKLTVELLSSPPQDAHVYIEYIEQTNNKNYDVDPKEDEQLNNNAVTAMQIAFKLGAAAVLCGIALGAPVSFAVTSAVTGVTCVMDAFRTNPDNWDAYGGGDNAAWEQWNYPDWGQGSPGGFVRSASGYGEIRWVFNLNSASIFQLKITASVHWGTSMFMPSLGTFKLQDAGWSEVSRDVTINPG